MACQKALKSQKVEQNHEELAKLFLRARVVKEPFCVINADDYYGKEAFKKIYDFLNQRDKQENEFCMAGFILGNTLSENGTVTRVYVRKKMGF